MRAKEAAMAPERRRRGRHERWSNDIKETQGHAPNYPMIRGTEEI
jgi:hypothetical protein